MDLYNETKDLWRPEETMQEFFPYMLGSQLLITAITAFIFTRNYQEKGIKEGVRFGVMFGLLFAVMMSMSYVWLPISGTLAGSWALSGFLQALGLGIIFSLTYRK